jgi:hypothetical protein
MNISEKINNLVNNGLIKPKSRNEKNNLTILKLKKESNTFDYSLLRKELLINPKIKSRNVNKDICKNHRFSNNTFSSSFNNNFQEMKNEVNITSGSNSERHMNKGNLFSSIKKKIESALLSNKIQVNNIFSRNNPYNKAIYKKKQDEFSLKKEENYDNNQLFQLDAVQKHKALDFKNSNKLLLFNYNSNKDKGSLSKGKGVPLLSTRNKNNIKLFDLVQPLPNRKYHISPNNREDLKKNLFSKVNSNKIIQNNIDPAMLNSNTINQNQPKKNQAFKNK